MTRKQRLALLSKDATELRLAYLWARSYSDPEDAAWPAWRAMARRIRREARRFAA